MDRDGVTRWVSAYERAWRDDDVDAVGDLFTDDATYLRSPYEDALVGRAAIAAFWPEEPDAEFTMAATPVAVDGDVAVVRVEVEYLRPEPQEYRDLWVIRFAPDGRAEWFEEWAYWPGRTYTATAADESS
jgi:uncharacterized protein (TIGR02246 family)